MAFTLPALPYARDALAPHISENTLNFHYGKHHQAYVDNLNKLVAGTPLENASLEEVVKQSWTDKKAAIFNNSGQVWNHTFYWHSMKPGGGGKPDRSGRRPDQQGLRLARRVQAPLCRSRRHPVRLGLGLAGPQGRQAGRHQDAERRNAR